MKHANIYVAYAAMIDPELARRPTLLRFVGYHALRAGVSGFAWPGTQHLADWLRIDPKNVPAMRRAAEKRGYLVHVGWNRNAKKYRVEVPEDLRGDVDALFPPSPADDNGGKDEPIAALCTHTCNRVDAYDKWHQYCRAIGGEARARERFTSVTKNSHRRHQAWREHVSDVLRAQRGGKRAGQPQNCSADEYRSARNGE